MKTRRLAVGIVVVVAISMLFVPVAFAQKPGANGSTVSVGAWSIGIPGNIGVRIDQAIVVESGKVVSVSETKGVKDGLEMKLRTEQGNDFRVFLGPKWFVENQKIKFMPGDSVVVKGKNTGSAIIATEISKGDWTMKLRNQEDGQQAGECCYPGVVAME
ncbi:MAG: hypothetical protein ABSG75_02645 [Syntrophales bacterium]|jgi:hypothetical protein